MIDERTIEDAARVLAEMAKLRDSLPPLGVPVDEIVISEEEARRRSEIPGSLVETALKEGRVLVG